MTLFVSSRQFSFFLEYPEILCKFMCIFDLIASDHCVKHLSRFSPLFDNGIIQWLLKNKSSVKLVHATLDLLSKLIQCESLFLKFSEPKTSIVLLDKSHQYPKEELASNDFHSKPVLLGLVSQLLRSETHAQMRKTRKKVVRLLACVVTLNVNGSRIVLESDGAILSSLVRVLSDELCFWDGKLVRLKGPELSLIRECVQLLTVLIENVEDLSNFLMFERRVFLSAISKLLAMRECSSFFEIVEQVQLLKRIYQETIDGDSNHSMQTT